MATSSRDGITQADHPDRFGRRRFVTRHDVEDAAASGQPIAFHERDVVTSEAAQRAADLGVRIERDGVATGSSAMTPASTVPSTTTAPVARTASAADLRRAVRAAVVAEFGSEPPGLDAVIDRVLKSRSL
jgi:hypothetical protein